MSDRPTYTITGATGDWELVMGLEIHAQVASNAKLIFRSEHSLWRGAKYECCPRRRSAPRYAAGDQCQMR